MNEMLPTPIWTHASTGRSLIITKLSDSSYRLTDNERIVADFTSFELAVSYAHDEFIL
jgi:hypothetical protein